MKRILILGNSGSGKTAMARSLVQAYGIEHLDLDSLAWDAPEIRRPLADSTAAIRAFIATRPEWVIEGCYADLLEVALLFATEMRFLNPGTEVCLAHCRARPWEPEKYASKEEQDQQLPFLLAWVSEYESRDDEYSLAAHRRLFELFVGPKQEYTGSTA